MCGNLHGTRTLFYGLKDYEEAVLWYLNAASETPSIIDIHSSGDAPLACLSKCYSTLAAQAKQDKNAELSAAFYHRLRIIRRRQNTGRRQSNICIIYIPVIYSVNYTLYRKMSKKNRLPHFYSSLFFFLLCPFHIINVIYILNV